MPYVLFSVLFFALAAWTSIDTRKVRDGWMGPSVVLWSSRNSRIGSHDEFAAKCRRGLTFSGWFGVVCGAIILVSNALVVIATGEYPVASMLFGLAVLNWGAVCFWCRRLINPPRRVA